jgi:hypothetical protein
MLIASLPNIYGYNKYFVSVGIEIKPVLGVRRLAAAQPFLDTDPWRE